MRQFILKTGFFLLPFAGIILLYLILDPFKVLYNYESFYGQKEKGHIFLNSSYVGVANFENHYDTYRYDSFIFGNSRSFIYKVSEWEKHIGEHSTYHLNAAGESLYVIHKKVAYLDKRNVAIKHALLVLDYDILKQDKEKAGHLGISPPQFSENQNIFNFHLASLKGFFNIEFLYAYIDFRLTGKIKPYMIRNMLIESRPFEYDYSRNEFTYQQFDSLIAANEYYKGERMEVFFPRDSLIRYSPPAIGNSQLQMLQEIVSVFKKHKTVFKVIISPLYGQEHLAKEDVANLKFVFGHNRVFDFSGRNNITNDYRNYYETSHYRPDVASELLNIVYGKSPLQVKTTSTQRNSELHQLSSRN